MIGDCEKDPTIFRKFARRVDWWLDRINKYGVKDDEAALMLAAAQTADEITDELEDFNKEDVNLMGVDGIMNHLSAVFSEQALHTKSRTMHKYENQA